MSQILNGIFDLINISNATAATGDEQCMYRNQCVDDSYNIAWQG
jgi:hypothetical protein